MDTILAFIPEFDKNAAYIWACYGLGAFMIAATAAYAHLKARIAKANMEKMERLAGDDAG